MPQRRYYCDYCGRSFVDTKEKRDAHFQSQVHQNNVRMWYESRKGMDIFILVMSRNRTCSSKDSFSTCMHYFQKNGVLSTWK